METSALIEGLIILEKYRHEPNGCNTAADHDIIYVYATDKPVKTEDINRLIELGWEQEFSGSEFTAKDYNPEESWQCYP